MKSPIAFTLSLFSCLSWQLVFSQNNACIFNGTTDYIPVPTDICLRPTSALTVEARLYVTSFTANDYIINRAALLIGGVKYDLDSAALSERNLPAGLMATRGPAEGKLNLDATPAKRQHSSWAYLGWTKKEVTAIQTIVKAANLVPDTRTDNVATEEYFKQVGQDKPSPRVIHLATHGYFFPDPNLEVRGEK